MHVLLNLHLLLRVDLGVVEGLHGLLEGLARRAVLLVKGQDLGPPLQQLEAELLGVVNGRSMSQDQRD